MSAAAPSRAASREDGRTELVRLRALSRALLERTRQLEGALESRVVIEQAKGMLAERYAVDVSQAFELLRRAARTRRLKVRELAAAVVSQRETPTAIADERARSGVQRGATPWR